MFTGLIETTGTLTGMRAVGGDTRLTVDAGAIDLERVGIGDSIAVDGVCLTAVAKKDNTFDADVSVETLSRTTLGNLEPGATVNLETSLTLDRPLGGHLVTGHVDCLATLTRRAEDARSVRMWFETPREFARYTASKGAVCLNGISLTVNTVDDNVFDVNIVPHTLSVTNLGLLQPGGKVNMEVDIIARYLERMLQYGDGHGSDSGVSLDMLKRYGFAGAGEAD